MSKKKILIIEDEKTICRELTELLTNEGYEAEYLEQFDNAKNDILEKFRLIIARYKYSGNKWRNAAS